MNRIGIQIRKTGTLLRLLFLLAGALLFCPQCPVLAKDQFKIDAAATRNAVSECYDLQVTVANLGENINATVRFEVAQYSGVYGFEEDAALPGGSEKTVKFRIPVSFAQNLEMNGWSSDKCKIKILANGKELQTLDLYDDPFSGYDANTILEGILSDHPNQLSWLDNAGNSVYIAGQSKEIKQRKLSADFTQEDLSDLHYLVVDDVDTSVLTQEQIDAIEDWTKAGGALIIGTGGRPETLSGFTDSFLDASVAETYLGDYSVSVIDYGNSYVDPQINMELHLRQIFDGVITILPIGIVEMKDFYGNPDPDSNVIFELQMLYDTLSDYSGLSDTVSAYNMPYYTQEAFNYLDKRVNLSFGWLRFLILLYVVLIGPLLYLILKKIGKREHIWIILPAVSLVFVLIIMLAGLGNRISGLRMKAVSVAAADGSGNRHTYLTGFHSSNRDWKIRLSEDAIAASPRDDNNYSGKVNLTVCKENDRLAARVHPEGSFKNASLYALYNNTEKGKLSFAFSDDPMFAMKVTGELKNETDHDFAYVLVSQGSYGVIFRDVKSGEKLTEHDTPKVENSFSAGDIGDTMRSMASDFYYDKKYEEAAAISALLIGYTDITSENNRQTVTNDRQTVVIGVTEDQKKLVEANSDVNAYLCLFGE